MAVETKFLYVNRDNEPEVELLFEYLKNGWRVVRFQSSIEEITSDSNGNTRRHEVVEWYYHLEKPE